jgi:hypothetical protein
VSDSEKPRRKPPAAGKGRPKGALNKATVEAREVCAGLVGNPAYLELLRKRLHSGKCAPAVEAMIWHYAHGRPKETLELTGADGGPLAVTHIARVIVDGSDTDA